MLAPFLKRHAQFLPFALIGVLNTALHGGLLILAVERFGLDATFSNLVAFLGANLFSYWSNSRFTFNANLSFSRYGRFLVASLLSLTITLLISWGAALFGLHYLVGFAMIAVFVPIFSFVATRIWAFKRP